MTKIEMRETLQDVRDCTTDPMMRVALSLAISLVTSRLTRLRAEWLVTMLRDISYDCDCRGEAAYAGLLRRVALAVYAG